MSNRESRLNILHILLDQLRADALACMGNGVVQTPNIDRLHASGVTFTNTYTPSPVCVAARCSMIYSQYPQSTGTFANAAMPQDGRETFMAALSRAGYRTHGVGKCHFLPDYQAMNGFQTRQRQEEIPADCASDDYLSYLEHHGFGWVVDPHGPRSDMFYIPQVSVLPPEHHPVQWIGDQSLKFLEEQQTSDQPWYLFSSFIHPHPPFNPPIPWHKLYNALDVPPPHLPQDCAQHWTIFNRVQNRAMYRDQGTDLQLLRTMRASYYACVSFVDYQIGRLLDCLDKLKLRDKTLIVFTSDHGEYLGDFNCFAKRGMHDAAAKVPMILNCPGRFDGGRTCATPASLIDLGPTFLSLAGTDFATHQAEGLDLHRLMSDASLRHAVFSQHGQPYPELAANLPELGPACLHMIATQRYTYARSTGDNASYLYDRQRDPAQFVNLNGSPMYRDVEPLLDQRLREFLTEGGGCNALDEQGRWKKLPQARMASGPESGHGWQENQWADYSLPGYERFVDKPF
jgi:arylsulfatase